MFGEQEGDDDIAADNRLNEPFVGHAHRLLRVRQQRRAHREGNIADEGYVRDMREFEPFVEGPIQRIPIDVFTIPVYRDYKWIVPITTNPNEITIRCATEFVGQQNEQRPINLLGENPRTGRQRLEVDDVTVRASSMFGWVQLFNGRYYIEWSNRLNFRAYNAVIPFDKEVFPVLTMGPREEPIMGHNLKRELTAHYDYGNYLMYKRNEKEKAIESSVLVLGYPDIPYELRVKTTVGNLRFMNYFFTRGEPKCIKCKSINYLLEISNTIYPYVGIYGGGPIPPKQYRITWDQPRDVVDNQLVGHQVVGNLRFEIDNQDYGDRIGYLCSKDALMYSYERTEERKSTVFLMKDYTFAIVDGYNRRAVFEREWQLAYNLLLHTDHPFLRKLPLQPKIVICGEGVNALFITLYELNANYRYANFYSSNIESRTILLDWCSLQADLGRTRPPSARLFRQVMHTRDINDWVHINHNEYEHVFLYSLSQYTVIRQGRLYDNWSVFALLEGLVTDGYYYLMCHLCTTWKIDGQGVCRFERAYHTGSPFDEIIDGDEFPVFERHNRTVADLMRAMPNWHIPEVVQFVRELSASPEDRFANQGPYTQHRFHRITYAGLQFEIT